MDKNIGSRNPLEWWDGGLLSCRIHKAVKAVLRNYWVKPNISVFLPCKYLAFAVVLVSEHHSKYESKSISLCMAICVHGPCVGRRRKQCREPTKACPFAVLVRGPTKSVRIPEQTNLVTLS